MKAATQTRGTGWGRRASYLLVGLAGLLMTTQPAAAANGGSGTGTGAGEEAALVTGDDYGGGATPFCLEVIGSTYVVPVTGTFTATNGTNTATYVGAATVTITTDATYYIAPEGTYSGLANEACDPATFGPAGPIAATISVTSSGGPLGGGISCTAHSTGVAGSGYFRVNSDFTVVAQGACTVTSAVTGVAASSGGNTQHVFRGELAPCLNPPVPCEASPLVGTWSYAGANQ